jgi:hypothetical protein
LRLDEPIIRTQLLPLTPKLVVSSANYVRRF